MGFRTLEISHAAEIYIKEGQMEITTEGSVVLIPIEDLRLNAPPKIVHRTTEDKDSNLTEEERAILAEKQWISAQNLKGLPKKQKWHNLLTFHILYRNMKKTSEG